ncbi:membrane skeletal protein [Cystoisospora suis]|uniref:Membrane skeletal protein n=1 Tax=Cystoisospora suis TaxID=483139 RepID=A0A2C6LD53_9APIC|nr:membrane skeletal protein [Cystoisospora suis]
MFAECCQSTCCEGEPAPVATTIQQQPAPGSRLVSGVVASQGEARILEPLVQERVVEVLKEEIQERVIEVPQVQYVDRIVEVPQHVVHEKVTHVAKPVIQERIKHVHKPVYQQKIIEVPQVKVVDKIVEVPQYVYQEKIIEVPRVVVQERVIPVPRKVIKEKVVEISQVDYRDVAIERPIETTEIVREEEIVEKPEPVVIEKPVDVEKLVEVPHIQHTYRNVMTPQYRHIPKPVEVPMTHYRPIPVEKIVDRNVPVPVELQIIQEYLCPKIEPRYKEVPVPVHVQRTIEHPVPKEAMGNPQLLPLYYQGGQEVVQQGGFQTCFGLSACCAPQQRTEQVTELGQGGTVEILAQQGYPSMPMPAGWDRAAPPAGWAGWSKEQVPTPLRPDHMPASGAMTPSMVGTVGSVVMAGRSPRPPTTAGSPRAAAGVAMTAEEIQSQQQRAIAEAIQQHQGAADGPYVQLSVTPLAPGQQSEVNIN